MHALNWKSKKREGTRERYRYVSYRASSDKTMAVSRQRTIDGESIDLPKTRKSYTREYKLEVVRFYREHNLHELHFLSVEWSHQALRQRSSS